MIREMESDNETNTGERSVCKIRTHLRKPNTLKGFIEVKMSHWSGKHWGNIRSFKDLATDLFKFIQLTSHAHWFAEVRWEVEASRNISKLLLPQWRSSAWRHHEKCKRVFGVQHIGEISSWLYGVVND